MTNSEQAMYLISLPLAQFRAIQQAIKVLARGGMCREEALHIIVQQHRESSIRQRQIRQERYTG